MAEIPNLKFDKNKAFLTEQLEIQKKNQSNVSDIIANIKFINTSYNCNQYYLEDLLKTGDELLTSFDSNITSIDELINELNDITSSLTTILSPKNQKSKTKSYFIKSFTELEKNVTEYSKSFNTLMQKVDNDNTTYGTFIASCNLNSAVDAAISDDPEDIMKIMQENLVEKDNIFSNIAEEDAKSKSKSKPKSRSKAKSRVKKVADDTEKEDLDEDNDNENNENDEDIPTETSLFEESQSDSPNEYEETENLDEDSKAAKPTRRISKKGKKSKKEVDITEDVEAPEEINSNDELAEENPSSESVILDEENNSDEHSDVTDEEMSIEDNSDDLDENIDENVEDNDDENDEESSESDTEEATFSHVSIADELQDILDNVDGFNTTKSETKDAISQGVQGLIDASSNFTISKLKNTNEEFLSNINNMVSEYDDFSVPISKIGSSKPEISKEIPETAFEEKKEESEEEESDGLRPIHINNSNFYNYDNSSYSLSDIEKARNNDSNPKPIPASDITDISAEEMANKTLILSTSEINARLAASNNNSDPTEKLEDINIEDLMGTSVPEETVKVDTIKLNDVSNNVVDDSDVIIDNTEVPMFDDYEEGLSSIDEVENLADALNNSNNVTITMEDKNTNVETVVKSNPNKNSSDVTLSKDKIEKIIRAEADNETLIISEKNNKIYLPYKMSEIRNYMSSYPGAYEDPSDVVRQEFILDLKDFMKHPSRTRFQETYTLIRNRDGKSVASAILYGLKLTKKSNLSPAVIAACKHQEELEVYLNCLNENKLSDFKAFNIIYEINPFKEQA